MTDSTSPGTDKPARAPKAAAQKAAAQKPAAPKSAAQEPAAQKPAAQKPAAQKPAARKPATSKPAASKPTTSGAAKASTPPPVPPAPAAPPTPPAPPAASAAYASPPQQPYVPVPLRPDEERNIAMLSHLVTLLVNLVGGGWIAALIFYVVYRERGAFVRAHAATELNFQITMILAAIAGSILLFIVVGIFVLVALPVLAIVFGIIATMKANAGEWYTYPIAIRFVS